MAHLILDMINIERTTLVTASSRAGKMGLFHFRAGGQSYDFEGWVKVQDEFICDLRLSHALKIEGHAFPAFPVPTDSFPKHFWWSPVLRNGCSVDDCADFSLRGGPPRSSQVGGPELSNWVRVDGSRSLIDHYEKPS